MKYWIQARSNSFYTTWHLWYHCIVLTTEITKLINICDLCTYPLLDGFMLTTIIVWFWENCLETWYLFRDLLRIVCVYNNCISNNAIVRKSITWLVYVNRRSNTSSPALLQAIQPPPLFGFTIDLKVCQV